MIENQRNHGKLSESLIPGEVRDTNQAVSEVNDQDQVVLRMLDYGRDTRELPPGDNLMENKQKAKPMKIVQHIRDQKSHGRLPQHLHTPSDNKEALQANSKTNVLMPKTRPIRHMIPMTKK